VSTRCVSGGHVVCIECACGVYRIGWRVLYDLWEWVHGWCIQGACDCMQCCVGFEGAWYTMCAFVMHLGCFSGASEVHLVCILGASPALRSVRMGASWVHPGCIVGASMFGRCLEARALRFVYLLCIWNDLWVHLGCIVGASSFEVCLRPPVI
jgi:hypothetical protein